MALEGNVLYAMIGEQELRDPTIRARRDESWLALGPAVARLQL